MEETITLTGSIHTGYRVASGLADDSPFPQGTIEMQMPHFTKGGLNLAKEIPNLYKGTLNVSITPHRVNVVEPDHKFELVNWTPVIRPETFLFTQVTLTYRNKNYRGYLYTPSPETKPALHVHNFGILEFIGPKIPDIVYGDPVTLTVRKSALQFL